MEFALSILEFVGLVVSFVFAGLVRRAFKSIWAKVPLFFVAVIAGNLVYFFSGIICAVILAPDPLTRTAYAHSVGHHGWEALGATVVAAIVGLTTSFFDRVWKVRKSD
jgi:hypothetical protein